MSDILYIVIPAYNEEANITTIAKEWYDVVSNINSGSRLVIIDDGSKDRTYDNLRALEAEFPQLVVITKPNAGHGATVLYGYKYAIAQGADYIFQTDSDGQTLATEFQGFWDLRQEYSAIIGYRNKRQDGLTRIFVTKVLRLMLFAIFGVLVTDANTPYRLMNRFLLEKYINDVPKNFNLSNILLTVFFVKNMECIRFIPITFRPRQGGVNSINLKRIIRIGFHAIKDLTLVKNKMKLDSRKTKND